MTKREQLSKLLNEMCEPDLVYLYNEYCQETNNYDDEIYPIDMFDEINRELDPWEIAAKVFYGDFNPNHDYFKFNGYANFISINKWDLDRFIDVEDIVKYILENDEDFNENDIRYILDEIGEEDDE